MNEKWYTKSADDIVETLKTNAASGLSLEAAKLRLRKWGINSVFIVSHVSAWQYAKDVLGDLTTILLVITAVIASVFEGMTDAYVICGLLIFSCILEVATYIKAHRILERIAAYSVPVTRVLRGGSVYIIDSRNVVRGDVILLEAGEAVPCDCRIISCEGLYAAEKGIVSDRETAAKNSALINTARELSPEDISNMLFGGTVISSGTAKAVAVETGEDTLVYAVRNGVPVSEPEKMSIIRKLRKYCHVVSLVMIFAVMAITFLDLSMGVEGRGLGSVFMTGMSLAVASMSEFFTAIGYIIVACSVMGSERERKKSGTGVIIKNTGALKKIGDAECVMLRDDVILKSGVKKVKGFYFDGEIHLNPENKEESLLLIKLLNLCLLSFGRNGVRGVVSADDANLAESEEIKTMESLYSDLYRNGINDEYKNNFQIVGHVSPGGSSRYHTALALKPGEDYYAFSIGNLANILSDCTTYKSHGKIYPLSDAKKRAIFDEAVSLEKESCTIIAVGQRPSPYNSMKRVSTMQTDLCFEGFAGIAEPMTPGSAQIISSLKSAGIRLVMLTDSVNLPEQYFASSSGFISYGSNDGYITGSEFKEKFKNKKPSEIDTDPYTVLAGFDIDDRIRFLEAEKLKRKTIYAGSGRGDTLLIAKADAGIVCISGASQTARVAADVLISKSGEHEGGIKDIYSAVCDAKNAYFNLKHAASYLIMSQTARLMLVLYSVIFKLDIMSPAQILVWGLIFDFIAVLIMAFEKPRTGIISKKIPKDTPISVNEIIKSAIFGLFWAIVAILVPVIARASGLDMTAEIMNGCVYVSSIIALVFAAAENTNEKSVFSPGATINVAFVLFVALAVFFVILCVVSDKFVMILGFARLDWITLLLAMIPACVIFVMYEIVKKHKI